MVQKLISFANLIICIEKPAHRRVVIPALQIVQLRLLVIEIPTIAERIAHTKLISHGAGCGKQLTPCIVLVFYHQHAGIVKQADYITLQIMDVGIHCAIELHFHRTALRVVEEVELVLLSNLIPSDHFREAAKMMATKSPPLVYGGGVILSKMLLLDIPDPDYCLLRYSIASLSSG